MKIGITFAYLWLLTCFTISKNFINVLQFYIDKYILLKVFAVLHILSLDIDTAWHYLPNVTINLFAYRRTDKSTDAHLDSCNYFHSYLHGRPARGGRRRPPRASALPSGSYLLPCLARLTPLAFLSQSKPLILIQRTNVSENRISNGNEGRLSYYCIIIYISPGRRVTWPLLFSSNESKKKKKNGNKGKPFRARRDGEFQSGLRVSL